MNIVYFDAVNDPSAGDSMETQVNRFMVAQAIMLSLAGMPGIYFHSLFGSRNDREAALESGINRRINRQKFTRAKLEAELNDRASLRSRVFARFQELLQTRRAHAAFAPNAQQQVLAVDERAFVVLRASRDGKDRVLCLHNLSDQTVQLPALGGAAELAKLSPYEVKWLALPR
jgi:sucrose phosphorylase